MQKLFFFLALTFFVFQIDAQNKSDGNVKTTTQNSTTVLDDNKLVSNSAFNNLIFEDVNFLILGKATPQQGIVFEYNELQTNLKLSGLLHSWERKAFITLDGEFKTDEGIYFLNNENGGKQAKFTLNLFKPFSFSKFRNSRKYTSILVKDETINGRRAQASLLMELSRNEITIDLLSKYEVLREKLVSLDIPVERVNKVTPKLKKDLKNKLNIEYVKNDKIKIEKYTATENSEKGNYTFQSVPKDTFALTQNFNYSKLLEDYIKISQKINFDSISKMVEKKELEIAKNLWTTKELYYFGFSPYYQRENLTIYKFKEDVAFQDNFKPVNGDLFGLNININRFYQGPYFLAKLLYLRVNGEVGRSSNYSSYKLNNLLLYSETGDSVNGQPVIIRESGEAHIGENEYTYATKYGGSFDIFYYPFQNFGFFSSLGYEFHNFSNDSGVQDLEKIPWRFGTLVNISGREKEKNIVTLQLFLDRNDLNEDPYGEDKDLRFGFKIGLPINIKPNL